MQPFHSDVNLGRRGGTQARTEPLNNGAVKDRWMLPPPPIISFDRVLRQGGKYLMWSPTTQMDGDIVWTDGDKRPTVVHQQSVLRVTNRGATAVQLATGYPMKEQIQQRRVAW